MLHTVLHGLGLQQLGSVDQRAEIVRIEIHLGEVEGDTAVGGGVALVLFHHIGKDVALLRQGEALHRLQAGEGLEAELGHIAEIVAAIVCKGLEPVPDLPVMHVAPVRVPWLVKAAAAGRAGRPVKGLRVLTAQDLREEVLIHLDIIGDLALGADPLAELDELLHLVVAAPQGEGRMVPQAADVVDELRTDILFKGIRQIIHRAGEHEVLPYQQAQLVADVVEPVVRIESAAPHADAVHVGGPGILQQPAGPFRVHPRQQIVLGDIVGAHGKNVDAVDAVAEALAPFVFPAADRHGAKADFPGPGIEEPIARFEADGHTVERLIAEAGRPPEPGLGNPDAHVRPLGGINAAVRVGDRDLYGALAVGKGLDMRLHLKGDGIGRMLLQDQNIADAGSLDADQSNVTPDAGVRKTRTPVPAEHAVRLPQQRKAHHGIRTAVGGVFCIGFADKSGRGRKADLDPVFPFPEQRPDLVFPGSVHVVCPADRGPVEKNLCQGIQAITAQQDRAAVQQGGVRAEAAGIDEVMLHQLQRFILVVPIEGIGDFPGQQQVVIDRAGYLCRDRPEGGAGDVQRPGAVQRLFLHGFPPGTQSSA